MEGNELVKNLYMFLEEVAKREKDKSIKVSDYGTAFILAILEGLFREAALNISS